ncbi:MAG: hypothetical protein Q9162_006225 [Coniocarpon cinnabarinum]
MESEDGGLFIKPRRQSYAPSTGPGNPSRPSTSASNLSSNAALQAQTPPSNSSWLPSFGRTPLKPARLFLTPNHLYYLLSRFDDLGVSTGPMNIRLENLQAEPSSSNYVSFMSHAQLPKIKSYDTDSIHSVASVKSLMSSVSSMLSNINFLQNTEKQQARKEAAVREDLRYLYSACTKVPCLKISVDHRLRPIAGYEEFPFDTAVPVSIFKNLTSFEVADIDFRAVYGWDILAESLQSLTVKRGSTNDLSELLHDVVMDDVDQRRRRTTKTPNSPLPLVSPLALSKRLGWPSSTSPMRSPLLSDRPESSGDTQHETPSQDKSKTSALSASPRDVSHAKRSSFYMRPQGMGRRSSGSSRSSSHAHSPRQCSTDRLIQTALPSTKWRFLRHLSVPDSGLTSVGTESLLPVSETLQSLDLSGNLFTEIPDALSSLVGLRALNLSNCLIDSLRNLVRSPLPAITVLNIRANKLTSLAGIESLKSLQRLDIRDNRLADPAEAARLTGMPDFYDLFVKRNPFTTTHLNNRITVFNLFRTTPGYNDDICIDSKAPERNERRLLADRVPLPPQATITEPVQDMEMLENLKSATSASQALDTDRPVDPHEAANASNKGDSAKSSQRRVRRRVADIADEAQTPSSPSIGDVPKSASVPNHETQPARVQRDNTEAEEGPSVLELMSTRQAPSKVEEQMHDDAPGEEIRPPMSRALSQSSEIYRQRIQALRNEHNDSRRNASTSPRLRRDPSLSPALKHQGHSGMFSPENTASITSIRV